MKEFKNGMGGRVMGAVLVSAALLVPLAAFGGPALARSGVVAVAQYAYGSGSGQYEYGSGSAQYRVQVCHLTGSKKHPAHTVTVSSKAVKAHLRHGDHVGACTGSETRKGKHGHEAPEHTTPVVATSPGHSDDHGKGHKGK